MCDALREKLRRSLPHLLIEHIHRKSSGILDVECPARLLFEQRKIRDIRLVLFRYRDRRVLQLLLDVLILVVELVVYDHALFIRGFKQFCFCLLRDFTGFHVRFHHRVHGRSQEVPVRAHRHLQRARYLVCKAVSRPPECVHSLLWHSLHLLIRQSVFPLLCHSVRVFPDLCERLRPIRVHLQKFINIPLLLVRVPRGLCFLCGVSEPLRLRYLRDCTVLEVVSDVIQNLTCSCSSRIFHACYGFTVCIVNIQRHFSAFSADEIIQRAFLRLARHDL